MFANYLRCVIPMLPAIKFEFVEEMRHPDFALMSEVLEDIKKRTAGLVAERNRLLSDNARLEERVQSLETALASCEQAHSEQAAAPPPITPPAPSRNPVVGERIRALVEEIDACIALMPPPRNLVAAEIANA